MSQPSTPETWHIQVVAREAWNDSGVDLIAGAVYDFIAAGIWNDASIPSTADGYSSTPILKLFEGLRRVPNASYFKLIGTIGKSTRDPILIGTTLPSFSPDKSGRLYCFANDVRCMYWNNHGAIALTIVRKE